MYVCIVCVYVSAMCVVVCVCVCSRAHTHVYIHSSSLCLSFSVYIVCHFVCVYLFVYAYEMVYTKHTHKHTGSRIHLWALFSRSTSSSNVIFSRANRGIGSQPREAPRRPSDGQRHAQYLLDLWLQGIRKQLANHLRHALWRKPSTMLRESTMTLANFS